MENVRKIIEKDLEKIEGWCSLDKAMFLIKLVEEYSVTSHLELGVYCGRSLLPVALAIKEVCSKKSILSDIVGCDSWNLTYTTQGTPDPSRDALRDKWWSQIDHTGLFLYTINLMKKYDVHKNVRLIRLSSLEYAKCVDSNSLDMLHQDGNHSTEISLQEVELYYDKVKKGGLWVFDDTDFNSTKPAQLKLESYGYKCIHDKGSWKVYCRM